MPSEIIVPVMGESVVEATIARWLKKEGEPVSLGEPLVELETTTLASVRVQNHSNDPNFLAASWHDIWLTA